jgi:SagB-type dehydrogenase family enzyme
MIIFVIQFNPFTMLRTVGIVLMAIFCLGNLLAQDREILSLPEPQKTGGMPLFEALNNRQSARSFSPHELTPQDLSNLLWAAFGVNREDGRRTAPSARNWQQIDIYVVTAGGWFLYDASGHSLVKLGDEDLRKHAGTQDFVATAPVNLVFVSDHDRMSGATPDNREFHSATDVGFISQNVYLFCASEGLATVVRGLVEKNELHRIMKLRPSQHIILAQTVGYPAP